MKVVAAFFCFFLCLQSTFARQSASGVEGSVTDNKGAALVGVTIALLNANDHKLVKADVTNDKGFYRIEFSTAGDYIVQASFLGFNTYTSDKIKFSGHDKITLPVITLSEQSTTLGDVTVKASKPLIEVQADKLVVNVENSIVNTGSSALEVLSRSPGVSVDQNDNISLKGKQGVTIMMDGKLVPISGEDLANMLRGMSASSIEKIELISNPSARYDAAGTGGIINIITKKNKKDGFNGSVNANYGQGIYPKAGAGFNLNYRNKKLNVYSSYNYAYRKNSNELQLDRRFYQDGVFSTAYKQHNYITFPLQNHTASLGADYSISPKTSVGASFTGSVNPYSPTGSAYTHVVDAADITQSRFSTYNTQDNRLHNYAVNANIRHKFDSTGTELSVDADYARYWNSNTQDYTTQYYLADGSTDPVLNPYLLHGDLSGLTQIRALKADFTHNFKNGIHFEAGGKSSYVTADNQSAFYDQSNGGNVFDSSKSNHFIYDENINAAYVNGSKEWKKWSTQIGLRLEQTNIEGDQKVNNTSFDKHYTQLFPSISVHRHINEINDLGLTLSRRIERPDYSQLNPFKFYLDPTSYREGNPYLNPALTYAVELSHTYKNKFITTLSFSRTTNVITEVIQPVDSINHVSQITDKNLASMSFVGLSGAYPIQVFKWWNSTNSINLYYAFYEGNLANTPLKNGKPAFELNSVNSFILPRDWSLEGSLYYQSAQVYGYMNLKPIWMLNAGVQKNILSKQATIKLSITDIFRHGSPSGTNVYSNYYEAFVVKRDTRVATISFVYRFGRKNLSPVRRRSSGAEDEIRRAGSGG
ncbi:TonB dependent receptor [Taibaiella soli]|nr:TonB dependent receptor [Taibaiella soli]